MVYWYGATFSKTFCDSELSKLSVELRIKCSMLYNDRRTPIYVESVVSYRATENIDTSFKSLDFISIDGQSERRKRTHKNSTNGLGVKSLF